MILGADGLPADAPRVLPRAPVVWLSETEGVATHPVTGARIGPFRILIENKTKFIPPEHLLPYEP
jgi:hypothetical protein